MTVKRPEDDLRALAADLRASVSEEATAYAIDRAFVARKRSTRRLVLVLTVLGLMLVANVAFAGAVDSAVPGELLYPFDRAHEWIADRLGTIDHTPERVTEARVLVDRQDYRRALALATEIGLEAGASPALLEELEDVDLSGDTDDVKSQVLDLIAATGNVSEAAHSGDKDALRAAIAAVHDAAKEVAETASGGQAGGQGNAGGQPESEPDKKADSPSNTAPGQMDENTTTTTSVTTPDTAPGNGQGGGGQGGGQGDGQGGGQGQGKKP